MPDPVFVLPRDRHNEELVANVHPADWTNPKPSGRYNLVVIGGGTAGLITSLVASSLGARVALVERHLLGGDCLNVGCVPSKAVIRAARRVHEARMARELGLGVAPNLLPDFGAAMERMRRIRARISHDDSAARYRNEFGVDVFLGNARFTGPGTVDVDGTALRFKKAVIATGARATAPPIEGLAEAGYLTNETVFELTERPKRLAVIGAGPIGCELAQAFSRLGSRVSLLEFAPQILTREDPDAAEIVQNVLVREGVELVLGAAIRKVERKGDEKRPPLRARRAPRRDRRRRDPGRRRSRAERGGSRTRVRGRRVRPASRREGGRSPAHHEPPHLRGGRRVHGLEVHARGGCRRQDRGPERALPRPQEALVARDAVVHLHRPRGRARRASTSATRASAASRSTPTRCRSPRRTAPSPTARRRAS